MAESDSLERGAAGDLDAAPTSERPSRDVAGASPSGAPRPPDVASPRAGPRRTVARRLLVGYALVLLAFAITMIWSVRDMRAAALEGELLRSGYVPLEIDLDEVLAEQNVLSTQLNHVTGVETPADVREWIDTLGRTRPGTLASARKSAESLPGADPAVAALRDDLVRELDRIAADLRSDPDAFANLFRVQATGDRKEAERALGELVKREADAAARIRALKSRVEASMAALSETAKARERRSLRLLVALSMLTMLVGVLISLYAARVLRPLSRVTERAKAVAAGDLAPRDVVQDASEIGELAVTFENMVRAIKAAREELVHAERLATIGKMAAHITHEIRNPLSSIGLNLELLEGEIAEAGPEMKESRELLVAIKNETARLARISEQYLSVARRPSPTLELDSVGDVVRELVAFVKPEMDKAGVRVVLDLDDDAPRVMLDESQLRQALLNLVRNAREAMTGGGELTLRLARAVGGGIDLSIEDDGPGIPDDARAHIFDPFFTTKQRGTGLGLAVTREIVEAHGGVIVCEARAPRGTRFRIHLAEPASTPG